MQEQKKIFLGIDTSTDKFMLVAGTETSILNKRVLEGKRHSEKLIPEIDRLLKESQIDKNDIAAVGGGIGPGSFTGIRVGLSCAFTFAQVLEIPVYGISSMDLAGKRSENVLIHAFRDKYYHARYDKDGHRLSEYKIVTKTEIAPTGAVDMILSPEDFLQEIIKKYNSADEGSWEEVEPLYIMDTVYKTKKDRKEK